MLKILFIKIFFPTSYNYYFPFTPRSLQIFAKSKFIFVKGQLFNNNIIVTYFDEKIKIDIGNLAFIVKYIWNRKN